MANSNLFQSAPRTGNALAADTVNNAGGVAYAMPPKHALAQLVATGTFNDTVYTKAEDQLKLFLNLSTDVDSLYLAKLAVYGRQRAFMKDTPAMLAAILAARKTPESLSLLKLIFPTVIDNPKQVRNFVQILRSGVTGRKSLGTAVKKLIGASILRNPKRTFTGGLGDKPTMADVIKLARPKPENDEQRAFLGYMIDKAHDVSALPSIVKDYEAFKSYKLKGGEAVSVPDVDFRMLATFPLTSEEWAAIAEKGGFHMVRMNLNTFERHGVFKDPKVTAVIAAKLRDREAILKAKVFPYQILIAYLTATTVPVEIREALQDAMEIATENVPALTGSVYVFPDISGSMDMAVTGSRGEATSAVTCKMTAALISSAILRTSRQAKVIPFSDRLNIVDMNPRDSVMTNTSFLNSLPNGGTACSLPLQYLNDQGIKPDVMIYVSDYESWLDSSRNNDAPRMATQWARMKARNPNAKLICINLAPGCTLQVSSDKNVLNIGGFSDLVFDEIARFINGTTADVEDVASWVQAIEATTL